ncbi:MAG: J domain-containing protein [Gammaproteobacteria bacterium]|nr:MAG: J domain-containing protein [Gammaproteobacteria bacterium]
MEFKDYYAVMGVARDASQDDIRRAYRKLARRYHPDVSKEPDAESRFKELGEAYEVLKDPEKRAAYDQLGARYRAGEQFRPPPDWDAGFEFSEGTFDRGGFSDFFEELFGRRRPGGHAHGPRAGRAGAGIHAAGEDHHARVAIDLEDAIRGGVKRISLQVPELTADGHVRLRERALDVKIPAGVREGQQIRLAGQGAPGLGQGPAGDLYLEILFRPHPRYRVEDGNLYVDLPVAPWEAALGATITVPTPGGDVGLRVPEGSPAGRRLRLKGRGLPGTPPGDLYVVLQIAMPPVRNDSDRAAWQDLAARLADFKPRSGLGGKP